MNKRATVLAGTMFFLIALVTPACRAQEAPTAVKAREVIGLGGVKNNEKGTLKVESGNLVFAHGKTHTDVGATSISDAATGADSQRAVGGTVGTMTMVAPYGSGRLLSLFRNKIDTLSIQYHDSDGSLHGVIFTMPVGASQNIKKNLVAQGAKVSAADTSDNSAPGSTSGPHDQKNVQPSLTPAPAPVKMKTSAIQVLMIQSDEIKVPDEFRIALYENLVTQLQKKGQFQHVYREGDNGASAASDLVVLHSSIRGFKQGSERTRQVTTVAGSTSIKIHCQFTGTDGKTVLERDVDGKVRFFGGNLRATYDFAKKAAQIPQDDLSSNKGS